MKTILIDMPIKIRGYIYYDLETGIETCVINSKLSFEQQRKVYMHELTHRDHDDVHSDKSIQELEDIRHREEHHKTFGFRLQSALDYRRMRVKDLAAAAGIPASAISEYLHQGRVPRMDRIKQIANILMVDINWLLGKDVDMEL